MKTTAFLVVLALASPPVFGAATCPSEMSDIDAALPNFKQQPIYKVNEVKRLRIDGEKLYLEGKLAECMAVLGQAKDLLGIGAKPVAARKK